MLADQHRGRIDAFSKQELAKKHGSINVYLFRKRVIEGLMKEFIDPVVALAATRTDLKGVGDALQTLSRRYMSPMSFLDDTACGDCGGQPPWCGVQLQRLMRQTMCGYKDKIFTGILLKPTGPSNMKWERVREVEGFKTEVEELGKLYKAWLGAHTKPDTDGTPATKAAVDDGVLLEVSPQNAGGESLERDEVHMVRQEFGRRNPSPDAFRGGPRGSEYLGNNKEFGHHGQKHIVFWPMMAGFPIICKGFCPPGDPPERITSWLLSSEGVVSQGEGVAPCVRGDHSSGRNGIGHEAADRDEFGCHHRAVDGIVVRDSMRLRCPAHVFSERSHGTSHACLHRALDTLHRGRRQILGQCRCPIICVRLLGAGISRRSRISRRGRHFGRAAGCEPLPRQRHEERPLEGETVPHRLYHGADECPGRSC